MYVHKTLEEKVEECKTLLRSIGRPKIEDLIRHIDRMGYFIAPGSTTHHRFEGGLVSHSLETYHYAMNLRDKKIKQGADPGMIPAESVIISALMHDLCKADALRFDKRRSQVCKVKSTHGHSTRSVRQIGYSGFILTDMERDAILWHMGGRRYPESKEKHFARHPLSEIIYSADKKSIGESKKRHHRKH